ncbi:MAG: hypothetical protein ACR2FN_04065 [Chitinophagaceae bacterium]
MKKIIFCALLFFSFSCKYQPAIPSRAETEKQLKKTMQTYLYKGINNDSSKAKYYVENVIYFEDTTFYDCEFTVKMTQNNHDTTGMMTAIISKDFATVKRKS